ncbi:MULTISPECIES: carboxymuconolactone decarboxylase family protein [unclassified Paracoccus (in: a-proteobacteria)]|uniref:carboxymuconolactone decarboxylase family protein n=1 Tax=unclassified Paracoccus (in: a-proteobacteria) TaxID=2688777 RepID=UPI0012B40E1D|nr:MULTISPECIES: carboxymuconolactone decarboxylase family protein [unclassified Paracoccus (in: a-proteobacteria)]UXU74051.1 carboxymuconolactone decarboxylase family protein [Paracoccus sp. SMMA_5]UXU79940.1 carboxymuconolactone decarboxylase family protein [Paracoccus sp. SMMA_5_TC]
MTASRDKLDAMNARAAALFRADSRTMGAFRGLMRSAMQPGTISVAMKELIALAVAIGRGCEDCVIFHTSEAKAHGASREELLEVLAVAIEMSGGPGTVYAAKALGRL